MIRARFKVNAEDPRPIFWPLNHPYWVTGYLTDNHFNATAATIVAYADDEAEILKLWPDAEDIDAEEATEYKFTDRFLKPEWFNP
jgi:hypothetical protein